MDNLVLFDFSLRTTVVTLLLLVGVGILHCTWLAGKCCVFLEVWCKWDINHCLIGLNPSWNCGCISPYSIKPPEIFYGGNALFFAVLHASPWVRSPQNTLGLEICSLVPRLLSSYSVAWWEEHRNEAMNSACLCSLTICILDELFSWWLQNSVGKLFVLQAFQIAPVHTPPVHTWELGHHSLGYWFWTKPFYWTLPQLRRVTRTVTQQIVQTLAVEQSTGISPAWYL